jgi:hypothetical protein
MLELAACAPMIFDRFHLSPVVYGKVLRDGPELDDYDLWGIEGFLAGRGYTMILCSTDLNTMVENNRKEVQLWQETRSATPMHDLKQAYFDVTSSSHLWVEGYDYQKNLPEETMLGIKPELPMGLIGSFKPAIWLVGDEKQQTRDGIMEQVPFYTPHVGHQLLSGTLLHRSLKKLNWNWMNTVMCNSVIGAEVAPLSEWYDLLTPRFVIALGGEASQRLDRAEVPHVTVKHPQYMRRFHHRTCEQDYPEELENARKLMA